MALLAPDRKRRKKKRKHVVATAPKPAPRPAAKPAPVPSGPYQPVGLPSAFELLVLNRFGQGYTPAAYAAMVAAGGATQWFQQQLSPASVPEAPIVATIDGWFGYLTNTPAQKAADNDSGVRGGWEYSRDLASWTTLRRVFSQRSLLETMTGFWSDVLSVSAGHDFAWAFRADYDQMLRQRAFGKFSDLLREASLHPAMRLYLDNWTSKKGAPNENQGRELLELHSVSIDAGYSEADVKASAVILSGYTVHWGGTTAPYTGYYNTNAHTTGPVTVLGFSDPNGAADGQSVTLRYLDYLAHHDSTARTLARRLATRFVSDNPPSTLIDTLVAAYQSNDTDVSAVLLALVNSPEFASSHGQKVRTPVDDLVNTMRVLGMQPDGPSADNDFNWLNYMQGGPTLFSWVTPDGAPLNNSAWSSASRMISSYSMHVDFAAGWWPSPSTMASYQPAASRLPTASCTFASYVDQVCRTMLGQPATPRLQDMASEITGVAGTTVIDASHAVCSWKWPRLASALLDTPEHMTT